MLPRAPSVEKCMFAVIGITSRIPAGPARRGHGLYALCNKSCETTNDELLWMRDRRLVGRRVRKQNDILPGRQTE